MADARWMRGARGNFVHRGREDGVWSAKAKTERDAGRRDAGGGRVRGSGCRFGIPDSDTHSHTIHLTPTFAFRLISILPYMSRRFFEDKALFRMIENSRNRECAMIRSVPFRFNPAQHATPCGTRHTRAHATPHTPSPTRGSATALGRAVGGRRGGLSSDVVLCLVSRGASGRVSFWP